MRDVCGSGTYQVVVSMSCNVHWLNAEVLEGLGARVDDLVHELSNDLVSATDGPPEELVQEICKRAHDLVRNVDVPPGLEDFAVHHFLELSHLVLLWSVELVRLSGSAVVVEHLLESLADINGVDGPEALLHVVRGDDIGDVGKTVEETILKAKDWGGSDNGSLGEDVADYLLAACLGAVELRGRVETGGMRREVDKAVDIVFGYSSGDAMGTFDVDILEVKVLCGIIPTNQVVDNVRMAHGLLDGLGVPEIVFLEGEIM